MKKTLFLIMIICCLFISCGVKDKQNYWDIDNIANINNSDLIPEDYSDAGGSYTRTGFKRKEGSTGIIGDFFRFTMDSTNKHKSFVDSESFNFTDDGKYEWSRYVQNGNIVSTNFNESGTYKLYKYSDEYFIFKLENIEKTFFYQVSNKGFLYTSGITLNDGTEVNAGVWLSRNKKIIN